VPQTPVECLDSVPSGLALGATGAEVGYRLAQPALVLEALESAADSRSEAPARTTFRPMPTTIQDLPMFHSWFPQRRHLTRPPRQDN